MGRNRAAAFVVAMALAIAACTSGGDDADPTPTTSAPASPTSQPPPATTPPPPPPTTQPPTSGTLTATLQAGGAPLAGAEVFLGVTPPGRSTESRFACTNHDGVVEFTDVPFDTSLIAITGQGVSGQCANPLFLDTSTSPAYPLVAKTVLPANTRISADRDAGTVSVSRLPGSTAIARESVAFYVSCLRDGDAVAAFRHFDRYLELIASDRATGVLTNRDDALIDANTESLQFVLDNLDTCRTFQDVGQVPVLYEWNLIPDTERPTVTLLDPGSEPRRVLTYTPEPGNQTETTLRQTLSQTQEIDGELASSTTTIIDVAFTTEVLALVDEGFILESIQRAGKARSGDGFTQGAVNGALQAQLGASTATLMAPTGEVRAVESALESDLTQSVAGVAGSTSPLPTEPVGVGAVWVVEATIDALGFRVSATTTYTTVAIEGSLVTVELESVQDVDLGALLEGPPFSDAEVSVTQSGSGRAVWDLATADTVESSFELEQVLIATATFGGEESTLEQVTTTGFTIPSPGAFSPPEGTEAFVVNDATHVTGDVDYDQDPPAGGAHSGELQPCGYYDEPVVPERAVHSLEHGAVWITYQEDLPSDQIAVLEDLAEMPYVLVSPYPGLDSPVVASAWGAQLRFDSTDDPRLFLFVDWFASGPQTPEPGAPC